MKKDLQGSSLGLTRKINLSYLLLKLKVSKSTFSSRVYFYSLFRALHNHSRDKDLNCIKLLS